MRPLSLSQPRTNTVDARRRSEHPRGPPKGNPSPCQDTEREGWSSKESETVQRANKDDPSGNRSLLLRLVSTASDKPTSGFSDAWDLTAMSRVAESSHLDSTRQVARKNVEGYRLGHVRPVSTKAAAPASSSTTVSSTRTANRRPRVSGGHGATGNEQEQQRDGWWLVPPHVARTRPMARLRGGNRCSCLTVAHYYCAVATMVVVTLAALISQRSDLHALRQSATVPSSKKDQTHRKPRWKVSDPRPTTIATANTTGASAGAGTSPFESVPPPSIPLFQTTTNPALFNRHTCIQAIRARHQTILGPLLQQLPTSQSGGSILLVGTSDLQFPKIIGCAIPHRRLSNPSFCARTRCTQIQRIMPTLAIT